MPINIEIIKGLPKVEHHIHIVGSIKPETFLWLIEKSGSDLYDLLKVLNKKMAIITVSHDVYVISQHVKRIFCLNNKIVCNDAASITKGDVNENMKKILHSNKCIIH